MHNNKPYSFEKTDVRGLFLLNFSCTKVQSKNVSPIAGNNITYETISKSRLAQRLDLFEQNVCGCTSEGCTS